MHVGGGGGDGKGAAIAILVVAAVALVAVAAVEGSRFDGYAQLHPMQPVHLFGQRRQHTVMPLAWIDPQTAAWADTRSCARTRGRGSQLERAPLDRAGLRPTRMFGGIGTLQLGRRPHATRHRDDDPARLFPDAAGRRRSARSFFGWRDNAVGETLFESRYTLELQGYPVHAGPLHLGLYGGGGAAYRWEDGIAGRQRRLDRADRRRAWSSSTSTRGSR